MSAERDDAHGPGVPVGEFRSRRTFSEPSGEKTVHRADRTRALTVLAWSPIGLVLGALLGVRATISYGWGGEAILLGALLGWASAYFGPLLLMNLGGMTITSIYNPRGARVPPKKQYSQAESLVARGRYQEAVSAFELAVAENPEDPEPYLRVARVYRDELGRFEDAVRWLKRARREATMADAMTLLVSRELVELLRDRMQQPARAAPELARMAEERRGTPEGDWAARELAEVKKAVARRDGAS